MSDSFVFQACEPVHFLFVGGPRNGQIDTVPMGAYGPAKRIPVVTPSYDRDFFDINIDIASEAIDFNAVMPTEEHIYTLTRIKLGAFSAVVYLHEKGGN